MNKRRFLPVVMVAVLLSAIIGPGLAGGPSLAAQEDITIEYWENFIGSSAAQNWAIEQMEAKYPNLKIESVNYHIDDMQVKLPTALASGTGPDIVYADLNPKWLGRFVNEGLAISMADTFEEYGWDERVFDWAQEFATYGGEVYGIGHEFEVLGLAYNKKIFDELGLEPPETCMCSAGWETMTLMV